MLSETLLVNDGPSAVNVDEVGSDELIEERLGWDLEGGGRHVVQVVGGVFGMVLAVGEVEDLVVGDGVGGALADEVVEVGGFGADEAEAGEGGDFGVAEGLLGDKVGEVSWLLGGGGWLGVRR